ncbi:hypothetical protein [Gloeocapsa sp. PCC 73106]|uniref:hypothetical protein n=1 Tax=Gloeocapsa sp. PCC 73106 TaxID=102232 RepID=UPI0002AC2F76|nr:hypothetical protein [Gloeocapsa sp. PCC 73106]ELR98802.1 hypothetical protein GLO73106DRAFT_00026400 [Gloeocapsa sp. PCC 73106]
MKNYWFQFWLVFLISLGGVVILQLPRANENKSSLTQEQAIQEEQQKKLRLDLFKQLPHFGYQNLLANWVFLDFVQYYGDGAARELTGNTLSKDYFRAVVNKDPRFVDSYFILAPATSIFGGDPIESIALMDQGLQYIAPEADLAYQVWIYKAIDETLFLGDNQKARQSYLTAAEWSGYHNTDAARIAEQRATETAKFLATNPDNKLVQASAWVFVYSNARDDQTRELALEKIKQTGAEVIITPSRISVKMPETSN